jgi:transcriptional regulator with XRE-family HTH domain
MAVSSLLATMNTRDEQFFKELGARIAQARKDHGLTQLALAEQLGVAQQTLAHYEVGRARMPASMLPTVARLLTLSLDELMGQPVPRAARAAGKSRGGKRGPASRLEQQIQAVAQLPKTKQQFVSQMLDTVLAQVNR